MCTDTTDPEDVRYGRIWRLCDDYPNCLDELVDLNFTPVATELFTYFNARVLVAESFYFDLDFRSEFSVKHETTFYVGSTIVPRYHFLDCEPPSGPVHPRDFLRENAKDYLGYVTLRPSDPATVGRSMVPYRPVDSTLKRSESKTAYARTTVIENLNAFGVPLAVSGVPFMEQDGHLLVCSHVASWMAHYSAVLKGWVGRRSSASFATDAYDLQSYGRNYPSLGVGPLVQTQLLRRAGLPPEYLDPRVYLEPKPPLRWYTRPGFAEALNQVTSDKNATERVWLQESLGGVLSHYLNSGIPAILNTDDHSMLICGYYRVRDNAADPNVSEPEVAGSTPATPTGTSEPAEGTLGAEKGGEAAPSADAQQPVDSAAPDAPDAPDAENTRWEELNDDTAISGFLVHDDLEGPFRNLTMDELADLVQGLDDSDIVIPLPAGLWMSAADAEAHGAVMLEGLVVTRLEAIQEGAPGFPNRQAQDDAIEALRPIAAAIEAAEPAHYFLRIYAVQGVDFKRDFSRRIGDDNAERITGYATLPKYVWVVELLDRDLHEPGAHAVRATVVLDASSAGVEAGGPPRALLAHLPGQVAHIDENVLSNEQWLSTHTRPYASGRWNIESDGVHGDQDAVAQRFKTATM